MRLRNRVWNRCVGASGLRCYATVLAIPAAFSLSILFLWLQFPVLHKLHPAGLVFSNGGHHLRYFNSTIPEKDAAGSNDPVDASTSGTSLADDNLGLGLLEAEFINMPAEDITKLEDLLQQFSALQNDFVQALLRLKRMSGDVPTQKSATDDSSESEEKADDNLKLDFWPEYKVPNIVHFIWFGQSRQFQFLNALAFLSADTYIRPTAMFCHGDTEPVGEWWEFTKTHVPNLHYVYREQPAGIFDQPINFAEHAADVTRLEILIEQGGIYLDTDVIVVRSFDELRTHECVLDIEMWGYTLANGVIVAAPQAEFLRLWYDTYRTFDPDQWGLHSVAMPWRLYSMFPHLVHIENGTLIGPSWYNTDLEFYEYWDWSESYSIHIWVRYGSVPEDPDEAKATNNTIGQVMRHVLFESSDLHGLAPSRQDSSKETPHIK